MSRIRYPQRKRAPWRLACLIFGHQPVPAMQDHNIVTVCWRCRKPC